MTRVANTESEEELHNRVQALVLAYLCQKLNEDNAIVKLEVLKDRFGAMFPDNFAENITELFQNSNLVDITENNDFRLTIEGIAECRNRRKSSTY